MKNGIEHIVYIMFENRSFDHLLGWLYEKDDPINFIPEPRVVKAPPYNGLYTGNYYNQLNKSSEKVFASKIPKNQHPSVPTEDPHEPFEHVQIQIADNMGGFLKDFATTSSKNPEEIMQCYTLDSLPVLSYLAKSYAVSDAYYSSIPTQTNCNRAFSLTGNSIGYYYNVGDTKVAMVDNYWTEVEGGPGQPYEFTEPTVWNVLSDNGYDSPKDDWAVFYSQTWPGLTFDKGHYCFTQDLLWPSLKDKSAHFKDISDFFSLALSGDLPKFSFLEPTWYEKKWIFGHTGTDYHPPDNIHYGEAFLWHIYQTLKKSPKWENTLLIINFDEHGGTYDHVEPPSTVSPWHDPKDGTVKPELSPKHPFDFETLGVRVPLVLVSPSLPPTTVFRPPNDGVYDHTSVIATVLESFEIPREKWQLGSRVANTQSFLNVIRGIHPIVREESDDEINAFISSLPKVDSDEDMSATDLHMMIGHRYLWRKMQEYDFPEADFQTLLDKHFVDIKSMKNLNNAINCILQKITK